jgi:hypothetical protein
MVLQSPSTQLETPTVAQKSTPRPWTILSIVFYCQATARGAKAADSTLGCLWSRPFCSSHTWLTIEAEMQGWPATDDW